MNSLIIKNLHVSVNDKEILKGINLTINEGDCVALLGPNGNGKSTLFSAIMGNPEYKITEGEILFNGVSILDLKVDQRSKLGIFLGFQNPYEIPGVTCSDFYKSMINVREKNPISLYSFFKTLDKYTQVMKIPFELVNRSLNDGFSGGEKKRNEILQMLLLNPKLCMLDEIDSGLDVDALNVVSESILLQKEKGSTFIIISHYARLYELIKPNKVFVIIDGKIVLEDDYNLINKIDQNGYEWIKEKYNISSNTNEDKVILGSCINKKGIHRK